MTKSMSSFEKLEKVAQEPAMPVHVLKQGGRFVKDDGIKLKKPEGKIGGGRKPKKYYQPLPSRERFVGETWIQPGKMYRVTFYSARQSHPSDRKAIYEAELMAFVINDEVRLGFPSNSKDGTPRAGWPLSVIKSAERMT